MRAVQNFSIFLGPSNSPDEDSNYEAMAKTSDKSADEIYIDFVHEVISSLIMKRSSSHSKSPLDNIFSDLLKQPVWVNDPFLTFMLYKERSYPGIMFYPEKIVDHDGNPVNADIFDKKLIDAIGSYLGYILRTEWVRTLIAYE